MHRGLASAVLAVVALTRNHDRSPLLALPLFVGVFAVLFPILFVVLQ